MIKLFRTGLLTALLTIAALNSYADRLYVQNTSVLTGNVCDLNIVLESSDMSQYCAFQCDIVLPEGIEKASDTIYYFNNVYNDPNQSVYADPLPNGNGWRIVSYSPSNLPITGQTSIIAYAQVKAGTSATEGVKTGSIQNIVFTKLLPNGTTQTVRMDASTYTITVLKPSLDVTLATYSYVYNGMERRPAVTVTSGDQTLTEGIDYIVGYANNTNAGTATVTVTGIGTYSGISVQKTFTIAKAPLTIEADDKTRPYGQENPPLTWSASGFVNNEGTSVFTQQPNITTTATVNSPVNSYPIIANGASAQNYDISYQPGVLTVIQREAVLSWSNLSFIYDGQSHVPTATVTNLVGNDQCTVTVVGAQTNAGTYTATATALSNANYKLPAANTQTFTITTSSSTLAFDPVQKTYGDVPFQVVPTTNVSGGAITYTSGNTAVVTFSGSTATIVGVGTAVITATQAATANYGATSATFIVTVTQRVAQLHWDNLYFTYDGQSHQPTAWVTNIVGNDVCTVTIIGEQTNAGTYTATATALSNANYKLPGENTTQFTIAKAYAMLAFDPVTKSYGDAPFTVTPMTSTSDGAITYSSDNNNAVTVSGQTFTVVGVGTAMIAAQQAATTNYNATSATFAIRVEQREAVLSWSNTQFTYDGQNHLPTATVQNLVGNDQCTVTVVGAQLGAGTFSANAIGLSNSSYKLPANTTHEFTISKAPLTIKADDKTRQYGQENPELTWTPIGLVNGETPSELLRQPTLTTTATVDSPPGPYPITATGAEAHNYDISYESGVLTVTQPDRIIVTADNKTREYGEENPTMTWTVSGGTLQGEPEVICDAVPRSPVNNYPIILRQGTITNPNVEFVAGQLSVTKAPLTITARSYTIKQGDPLPEYEAEYTGFKLGETQAVLTQQPQLSCAAFDSSIPGKYPIRVYGGEARNYAITPIDGILEIVEADPIIITIKDYSREYGDDNPTKWDYDVSGGTLQGEPIIRCEATPGSPVGQYEITGEQGSITNYNVQFVSGTLTIGKAPLTITARSYTIKQGDPLPEFEAEYTGFKLNETQAVLTRQPQLSCAAFDSSETGTFPIRVYGAEAENYAIEYVDGWLTVNEANLITITAKSYSRTYGDDNPDFEYEVTGGTITGTPILECKATKVSDTGNYEIVVSRGTVSYPNLRFVNGTLKVTVATLTVTADDKEMRQGEPLPTLTVTLTGFKNNDTEADIDYMPLAYTNATTQSEPGRYDITPIGGVDNNYDFIYVKGTLTILEPEKGYTLVIALKDGRQEKFQLKDRPNCWMDATQVHVSTRLLSATYDRSEVGEFFFLDKEGNASEIGDTQKESLVIQQLAGGLSISGMNHGESVSIYDLSGHLLDKQQADTSGHAEVTLTQYPKGIYIIKISNKRTIKIQTR